MVSVKSSRKVWCEMIALKNKKVTSVCQMFILFLRKENVFGWIFKKKLINEFLSPELMV